MHDDRNGRRREQDHPNGRRREQDHPNGRWREQDNLNGRWREQDNPNGRRTGDRVDTAPRMDGIRNVMVLFVLIILYSLYVEYDSPLLPSASGLAG